MLAVEGPVEQGAHHTRHGNIVDITRPRPDTVPHLSPAQHVARVPRDHPAAFIKGVPFSGKVQQGAQEPELEVGPSVTLDAHLLKPLDHHVLGQRPEGEGRPIWEAIAHGFLVVPDSVG